MGTRPRPPRKGVRMGESVYKIIELVGTSTESWEKAASAAVARASGSLRDLRVAEVLELVPCFSIADDYVAGLGGCRIVGLGH